MSNTDDVVSTMKWLLPLLLVVAEVNWNGGCCLPPVVLVSGSSSDEEGATTKAITEDVDKKQLRQIVKESSLMFQQYISKYQLWCTL